MRHLAFAFGKPVSPRQLNEVQAMFLTRYKSLIPWIRQLCLQRLDIPVNLPVVQDVLIDLGERRVPVGDPTQQDHELEQVGIGLLPERLLRPAEQIVQQRAIA